ncbi:glycoside hydrolase family 32 protein [Ulvibacterium marinum]|uniref:glycoside hydrolase family 32 protein n=1 Tax=Ulvibacterium marinum TaxID=2419782 RepID=UPI002495403B|nr:glycoside hydrolase family 32 protein [Ulvibacterium marinum]
MKQVKIGLFFILIALQACKNKVEEQKPILDTAKKDYYMEPYRPQFHFSPEEMWMNDPNGLVHHKGVYHLFYQYYPDDIVWGPMHWGHAISTDLVHWKHKPIALYPDELGFIFSGSAVVDEDNTSGFGSDRNPALVAIFTYHDMKGEKAGHNDFQTQGIAYSLDNGDTWTKFKGNPVLGNEGVRDFRDPKVMWYEPSQSWVKTLVAGDHAKFYISKNLKDWALTGEFGKDQGAHGGVWECPDLFQLQVEGTDEKKWVLLISINPGAPNGGSGTQYFIGDFDGKTFTSDQKENRWIDWGMDNYAGVTYNNAPNDERIFIGWMSNWAYARDTPTEKWRSAMTVPRKLSLRKIGDTYGLINYPVDGLENLREQGIRKTIRLEAGEKDSLAFDHFNQAEVQFTTAAKDFRLVFKNDKEQQLVLTLDSEKSVFYLDRTRSGKTDFQENFGDTVQEMPIDHLPQEAFEVRILLDHSSVEVFINKGQYVMTAQVFPNEHYTLLDIENTSEAILEFNNFEINKVKGIW